MRHRLVSGTGLGNPERAKLMNEGKLDNKFADEAMESYFKDHDGFDFQVTDEYVNVGIEPSYQDDPLLIISIDKDKNQSYIQRGKAFGGYGTRVVKTTKFYADYKLKSKFVRFIDKWHKELFGNEKC